MHEHETPRLPADIVQSVTPFLINLPPALKQRLRQRALDKRMTMSAVLRDALHQHLSDVEA